MFVRMMRSPIQPGAKDDVLRVWREEVMPAAERRHGFAGATVLVDDREEYAFTLTRWDTLEDLEAGDRDGYVQAQVAKLASYLAGQPQRTVTELVFEHLPTTVR